MLDHAHTKIVAQNLVAQTLVAQNLATTSLHGWRVHQARDSGVRSLLTEVAGTPETKGALDTAFLRTLRAGLKLLRADLINQHADRIGRAIDDVFHLNYSDPDHHPDSKAISALGEMISLVAEFKRTDTELPNGLDERPGKLATLDLLVQRATELIRSTEPIERPELIECVATMLRVIDHLQDAKVRSGAIAATQLVLEEIGGHRMLRLFELGGDTTHVLRLIETIARISQEPRRRYLEAEALRLFDNLVGTRLYVTGAVARQPGSALLVRPFGLSHTDGTARPCDTLAFLETIEAMRPILDKNQRATQADELIELLTFNALMAGVSADAGHWFGPIPHSIDSTTDVDVFSSDPPSHPLLGPKWRPQLRSGGTEHQCCAASSLLSLAATAQTVSERSDGSIVVSQLSACEASGGSSGDRDGWSLTISGAWPYDGRVALTITSDRHRPLRVRIPEWSAPHPAAGSFLLFDAPEGTATFELDLLMRPRLISAHPMINDTRGRVAVAFGPMVYCLEGSDQVRHTMPNLVAFDPDGGLGLRHDSDHPEAYPMVIATGDWITRDPWPDFPTGGARPYREWQPAALDLPVEIIFIPFFAISNRGLWDMAIWIPVAQTQ